MVGIVRDENSSQKSLVEEWFVWGWVVRGRRCFRISSPLTSDAVSIVLLVFN